MKSTDLKKRQPTIARKTTWLASFRTLSLTCLALTRKEWNLTTQDWRWIRLMALASRQACTLARCDRGKTLTNLVAKTLQQQPGKSLYQCQRKRKSAKWKLKDRSLERLARVTFKAHGPATRAWKSSNSRRAASSLSSRSQSWRPMKRKGKRGLQRPNSTIQLAMHYSSQPRFITVMAESSIKQARASCKRRATCVVASMPATFQRNGCILGVATTKVSSASNSSQRLVTYSCQLVTMVTWRFGTWWRTGSASELTRVTKKLSEMSASLMTAESSWVQASTSRSTCGTLRLAKSFEPSQIGGLHFVWNFTLLKTSRIFS